MRLRIDNIEVEAVEGETILDAAARAGKRIPTLCHMKGVAHYSSCMVCMVRDKKNGQFIPSCSALASEGMDIDASGDDVSILRKKAVELLLSEHRAECEAPCRIVCPAGYNIPAMNRLLAAGKILEAIELSVSEHNTSEIRCLTCPGYCENACRRKKVDTPVSIRNLKIFVSKNITEENNKTEGSVNIVSNEVRKRFSSRIGRLDESELTEWLKEAVPGITRYREIRDIGAATSEAKSCMHCDCRAADNCRLRDLAQEFRIKDSGSKVVNSPIRKKVNRKSGLIFENAKCIKCGLCVRVCEDSVSEPALCFINRGFVSIISEPLTEEFDTILKTQTEKCISICPTGALEKLND